ncbi:MAG TPA: hypothetical protein PK392_14135, partial [Opitutaceae bacterium]|nr:hypothetical protein [Opitutaceae bacterium]
VYGIMRYQRTEVYFANWGPELTIVDQKQPLALIGVRSQESQLAVTPLPVGRHLLHQDISARMRNYMEVEIKRGLNVIAPEMTTVYMPSLKRRLDFHAGRREQVEATQTFTYPLYDKANQRIDSNAELSVSIKGAPDKDNPDLMVFLCSWKAVENGSLVGADTIELKSPANTDKRQERKIVIREDAMHYWYVSTYTNRRSAELEVSAAYIEYKKAE